MPLSDYFPSMEGWTPVDTAQPQRPGVVPPAQGPSQSAQSETLANPYQRCTIPITFTLQPDSLKQSNRPGLSSFRISPPMPSGSASVNAAAQSSQNPAISILEDEIASLGAQISESQAKPVERIVGATFVNYRLSGFEPIFPPRGQGLNFSIGAGTANVNGSYVSVSQTGNYNGVAGFTYDFWLESTGVYTIETFPSANYTSAPVHPNMLHVARIQALSSPANTIGVAIISNNTAYRAI